MGDFERLTEEEKHYYGEQRKIRNMCYMGFDGDCQYPTCSGCTILSMMRRLAQYEDIGSPAELAKLVKAKTEGRLVILPSKSEEIIRIVELALRIKLYDYQKAYITGVSGYVMPGRVSGKTTAYMIKLCLSEGDPIDLTKQSEIERYADEYHGSHYLDWFKHELWNIYFELKRVGGLKLRTIYFTKDDREHRLR